MFVRKFILFLLSIFCVSQSFAQLQRDLVQSRVLILLDRSSSMTQPWGGGKEKSKAADEMINRLVDSIYTVNPDVEIGLRIFGHQNGTADNNCYDTKLEVPFSKDNRTQIALRLSDIHPLGVSPIAYSLEQAARYDILDVARNAYCIVLITDGGESCGGDICDVMNKFLKDKIHFRPYIVSLEDYAPLKTTYACMGDYLEVLKKGDIAPAVGTIVEAFRPVLKVTVSDYKEMQKVPAVIPSVLKVSTPPVKLDKPKDTAKAPIKEKVVFTKPPPIPPGEKIADLSPQRQQLFTTGSPAFEKLSAVDIPAVKLLMTDSVVIPRQAESIVQASTARQKTMNINAPSPTRQDFTAPGLPPVKLIIDTPVAPKAEEKIARLPLSHQRPFNVIFVIEDKVLSPRLLPPPIQFKVEPAPVVTKKPEPEQKKGEFKVETEEAKETTVEIYFTNGKGKFYNTTPQVQLMDPGTNQVVKKFYRTTDENGNPDPQLHILPGRYDIAFTEKRGVVDKNVEVVAGKKNKIYVTVQNTSLSFAYHDAPQRPVKEFSAVVTERNKAQGRVQNQKCTELLEYEPGNYHIIINTFPQDVRNVDLDFNETEIEILQPGFAKFTSDGKAHDITLWRRLGDKFLQFYGLDIKDPMSQHLQIQPGEYQVHYQKGPGQKSAAEKVVPFLIKATQETEVILK
jgi:hypothetical protein